jgi:hypothetical protein
MANWWRIHEELGEARIYRAVRQEISRVMASETEFATRIKTAVNSRSVDSCLLG